MSSAGTRLSFKAGREWAACWQCQGGDLFDTPSMWTRRRSCNATRTAGRCRWKHGMSTLMAALSTFCDAPIRPRAPQVLQRYALLPRYAPHCR